MSEIPDWIPGPPDRSLPQNQPGYVEPPTEQGPKPSHPRTVALPVRPFLYTADQIAGILSLQINTVRTRYLFFEGRTKGVRTKDHMVARNIAPPDERPEWRVSEAELVRWMRRKGFKFYDRASISQH